MAGKGEVVVKILGDSSGLHKSLGEADKSVGKFGSGIGGLGKAIGGLVAGGALVGFLKSSVTQANEATQAQSKLQLALENNNKTVGLQTSAFEKLNRQLAQHTIYDDDAIAAGEAQLATFGANEEQIRSLIPTVVDLAAKLGVDLPAAADILNKASLGQVKALKSLGIEGYAPTGDRARDLANIQGLLADKVKGAAQAQLDAAGPAAKMAKSMDELQETVGSLLVPTLQKLADLAVKVTDFFATHPEALKLAGVVGTLGGAVWAVNAATAAWAATQKALNSELLLTMGRLGAIGVVIGGAAVVKKDIDEAEGGWSKFVHGALGKSPLADWLAGVGGGAKTAKQGLDVAAAGVATLTGAAEKNAPAVLAVAGANEKAAESLTTFAGAIDTLKAKDLSGWAKGVQQSIEGALDPTKRATVDPDLNFASLQKNMAGNLGDVKAWQKDLEALKNRGFPVLAGELAKLGPGAAKAVDEATRASNPALQKMQDTFVASAKMMSDSTILTLETELGGKLGPTLTRLGADAAVFFGKGFTAGLSGIGADTGNILAGIAGARSSVPAAPAPTSGGLLGGAASNATTNNATTNNINVNVAATAADPHNIARNIAWEIR